MTLGPGFSGPRATLSYMTTQYQILKICETAQRHNFTIYLEMSGNANVYSRLLSVQQQHDNIVHLGVRVMQAVFMKVVTKKNEKEKKRYLLVLNFPLTKSSQQRKTATHCKTPMKSNIVSIGSYVWLFLLDLAQTDCLLKLYMLVKSARTVSREFYLEKRVYIGLTSYG